jgi:hypothetical protein
VWGKGGRGALGEIERGREAMWWYRKEWCWGVSGEGRGGEGGGLIRDRCGMRGLGASGGWEVVEGNMGDVAGEPGGGRKGWGAGEGAGMRGRGGGLERTYRGD